MKITSVNVKLSEQDIIGIINEYVIVEGLCINKIEFNELITIEGSYKKGVNITFKANIGIGKVINNTVYMKVLEVKVLNIKVIQKIVDLTLKKVIKSLGEYGLFMEKDILSIQMDSICKFIPYVYFRLVDIEVLRGYVLAEVENLVISKEKDSEVPLKLQKDTAQIKVDDKYTSFRNKINKKIPLKYHPLMEYVLIMPDIIALLIRIFKDKRIDIKIKVLTGSILAYLLSPIDILPDFIPFVGAIDDVAVAFYGLNTIINKVPEEIIVQNWQGKDDIIFIVKSGIEQISKVAGSNNIGKLVQYIKDITTKAEKEGKKYKDEGSNDIH